MDVQILITTGNAQNPLANQLFKAMTDVTGAAVIAKAISQIAQKDSAGLHLKKQ